MVSSREILNKRPEKLLFVERIKNKLCINLSMMI